MLEAFDVKAMGAKTSLAFTTLAFVAVIAGSFTYLSVCGGAPGLSFCPAWGLVRRPTFTAAAPRCLAALGGGGGVQILGAKQTFLPPDALLRGTSNYGSGQRMERLGHKLLQGQPITVAFLGGSITWGRGGYEGGSFTNRFTEWLNATFPHPDHRVVNLGLPAVTSALFAACYDTVPEDADLVVLDFAVNDGHVSPRWREKLGYSFAGGERRGFEQLVRKSLRLRQSPAVALLHFFSWNATRDKLEEEGYRPVGDSFFFRTVEDELSTIAQYYDAPVLSLRNAVYHLMREQRFGFQWNVSLHFAKGRSAEEMEVLKQAQFFWDENHPWDRTGHRAMAELVMAAVSRGVQAAADAQLSQLARVGALAVGQMTAAARSKLAEARPLVALPPLPPPMVTGNYEANATSCHLQENFQAVIGTLQGFKYEPRAPDEETYVAQKWGLTADQPGAWATLEIDSGLGGLSGKLKSVQVHLLFLRSWGGMGRARVECAKGCRCKSQQLDGHWDRQATLTDLFSLEVSPHAQCQLKLTVLEESSSGNHTFSISGVVVSSVDAKMERGKVGQWEVDTLDSMLP
ncbi:expressed protein [Chlorella variabilis]|uniref:Expressed protein n=1 Tax=Chlorella variabilis TaxID=554065 RepID=E1Z278_CHLVA|nr:expressed protein [Chlorella variabilis]EFN59953.1 expressed protein [Chlorella variabilis]|eukprot:XP_005852055.1 expressed protein [Chlorella variabilis]